MSLTKASFSMITGAVLNVLDYGADPTGVADSYAAIQAALDAATFSGSTGRGWVVYLPTGRYLISDTLRVANATVVTGDGRHQTAIRPFSSLASGFSGIMITDKGNASKIFLQNFRMEALNNSAITNIIKMGYIDPISGPCAQATWTNLFIAGGVPGVSTLSTCTGIDIVTNVFSMTEIENGFCGTDYKLGPNSTVTTFDRCYSAAATNYGFQLSGSVNLIDCELEAELINCVGVYVSRETNISGLTYSGAFNNPYAIEIDAGCPLFNMSGFVNFQTAGTQLGYVIKDNRTTSPQYWGNPNAFYRNTGLTTDIVMHSGEFYIQNLQEQLFVFTLINTAGTIQHSIEAQYEQDLPSSFANKIIGATTTNSNTPTGTDATTAFVAGAKISSANKSFVIFNTESQTNSSRFKYNCQIIGNDTGTPLTAYLFLNNTNVNGSTKYYLTVQFTNSTTGSAFDLTTIAASASIRLLVDAYVQ
jgi:hypothetical protein